MNFLYFSEELEENEEQSYHIPEYEEDNTWWDDYIHAENIIEKIKSYSLIQGYDCLSSPNSKLEYSLLSR